MTIRSIVDGLIRAAGGTPPVDRDNKVLTDGSPVPADGTHTELKPGGQQKGYVVLTEEERARGFVRPVRNAYIHVGRPGPQYPLRELTAAEHEAYDQYRYIKYEEYPEGSHITGRFWTQADFDAMKGCGTRTTMSRSIAETYARDPQFYGGTFCTGCGVHRPVGRDGEFVWDGTDERVGT